MHDGSIRPEERPGQSRRRRAFFIFRPTERSAQVPQGFVRGWARVTAAAVFRAQDHRPSRAQRHAITELLANEYQAAPPKAGPLLVIGRVVAAWTGKHRPDPNDAHRLAAWLSNEALRVLIESGALAGEAQHVQVVRAAIAQAKASQTGDQSAVRLARRLLDTEALPPPVAKQLREWCDAKDHVAILQRYLKDGRQRYVAKKRGGRPRVRQRPDLERARNSLVKAFIAPEGRGAALRTLTLSQSDAKLTRDEAFELTAQLLNVVFPGSHRPYTTGGVERTYYRAEDKLRARAEGKTTASNFRRN
jgi:hypothetical protein